MAQAKVHLTMREANGHKVTMCGRSNPPHSTVSVECVTCTLCLAKVAENNRIVESAAHRW